MKTRPLFLVALLACTSAWSAPVQSTETFDLSEVSKGQRWRLSGRTVSMVEAKGKTALKFSEGPGMGVAWLDGYKFRNGVIEADILGRSQPPQGSFVGIAFRVVDAQTHDAVYFRPFNFRATIPQATVPAYSTSLIRNGPGKSFGPSAPTNTKKRWRLNRTATNGFT